VRINTRRSRVARLGAALAALVVLPATLAVSTSPAGAAASNKLTITAGEYVYKVSGAPKPGNVEIEFNNPGVEYHMLGIAQVKPKTTVKQVKAALLSDDESAGDEFLVNDRIAGTPGFLGPDQSTTTIANLPAGRYALFCFIPAPDGKSHIEHGMVKVFDVKGPKSSYKPPTDGVAEVSITDAGITVPSSGLPAKSWVKVTNDTSVPRSLTLAEYLTPDATFETADAYFDAFFNTGPPEGDPPASINGGIEGLAPNASAYIEVSLTSGGKYALVSQNNEVEDDPNELHTDFTAG
jgi:DNA gyrase inhibitor GyrI